MLQVTYNSKLKWYVEKQISELPKKNALQWIP